MRYSVTVLLLVSAAFPQCESSFTKTGNPLSGQKFSAQVTVPSLSVASAVAQIRGIAARKNFDILTEDAAAGSMLLEERSTSIRRAIPLLVAITAQNEAATVQMTVKLEKGVFAKADSVKSELCSILNEIKGGEAGLAAAAEAEGASTTAAPRKVDASRLSFDLALETKDSPESIPLRYKNRVYTISGRVDYVMKDGDVYRVAFDTAEPKGPSFSLPGTPSYRIGLHCLMAPSQSAYALTLRKGDKVKLTGTYYQYDQFRKSMWFDGCKPE